MFKDFSIHKVSAKLSSVTLLLFLLTLTSAPVWSMPVIITDGISGGGIDLPWSTGPSAFFNSARYQQVFDSSLFTGNGINSPFTITSIAYDNRGSVYSTSLPAVSIQLSTTTGPFLNTFGSNVGADVTTVFNGNLTLASSGGVFDTVINLTTPFVYDPSMGNLLLDVSNPNDLALPGFSNAGLANPTRVFNNLGPASGFRDSLGLSTQFRGTTGNANSVPEIDIGNGFMPMILALIVLLIASDARKQATKKTCPGEL